MSIWDGDGNPINFKMPTMGGKVFWFPIKQSNSYTLQQHKITGHCRILDSKSKRVGWGLEGPMRAQFIKLTTPAYRPSLGDVIGVHRAGGIYDHYGVYESDDCIYEFAGQRGDFSGKGKIDIHITSLEKFIGPSDNYFVLVFPEQYGIPGKLEFAGSSSRLRSVIVSVASTSIVLRTLSQVPETKKDYHLCSREETVRNAKKLLGNTGYSLPINNCEHYALWCKTGLKESHQVKEFLKAFDVAYPRPGAGIQSCSRLIKNLKHK